MHSKSFNRSTRSTSKDRGDEQKQFRDFAAGRYLGHLVNLSLDAVAVHSIVVVYLWHSNVHDHGIARTPAMQSCDTQYRCNVQRFDPCCLDLLFSYLLQRTMPSRLGEVALPKHAFQILKLLLLESLVIVSLKF
jgi:acyl carrier protein phosphodiesterase